MSDCDLIEIHVTFDRPKSRQHVELIARRIREALQRDLNERFPRQLPTVYVADVRGPEDEDV